MDNQDKIEERKRSNGRFLSAFDYTKKCLGMTQEELAKKMGKNGSLISDYRSGKKRVSRETMLELTKVTRNGLSLDYMLGLSNHMIGDATDESCGSQQMQAMPYSEYDDFEPPFPSAAEPSPAAAPFIPTWADSLIEIMTQQIKQNEALNRELRQSISDMHLLMSEVTTTLSDLTKIIKKLT